jgi:hypothetical protein
MFGSLDGSELDYDPLTGFPLKPIPEVDKVIKGIAGGLMQQAATPGAVMQPNPYPAGSEEATWYDQNRQDTMAQWAPGMALNTMGTGAIAGVGLGPGEVALGAGAVRRAKAPATEVPAAVEAPAAAPHPAHNPILQDAFHADMGPDKGQAAYEAYIAAHGEPPNVPKSEAPVGDVGGGGGDPGLSEAQAQAKRWAGQAEPLPGLPTKPLKINDQWFAPGPIGSLRDVAESYMAGRPQPSYHKPPEQYHPIDPEHSQAIARAFEEMPHAPDDPHVKASYDAMASETRDQFRHIIDKTGLKVEPIPAGMEDPYAANPRLAAKDVAENNHLWFYPTESGFGSSAQGGIDMASHPMMQPSGETLNGKPLLNNDLFRIVHDVFGHLKEGNGFRAAGEDNAWRSHAAMYSDLARPAMTTETRGQNSWVNFGPHGESNRTANGANTVFADQKVGLLPEWTMRDRGSPEPQVLYHGTPHAFDQFDISKIGGGEGNQAYGHGLYFAESNPVSEWYRMQLASRRDPLLEKYGLTSEDGARLGMDLANTNGNHTAIVKDLQDFLKENQDRVAGGDTSKATANFVTRTKGMIDYLNDPQRFQGYNYKVAIDRPAEHFVDWEKPYREQSSYVQEKLAPLIKGMKDAREAALPDIIKRRQAQIDTLPGSSPRRAKLEKDLADFQNPKHMDWEGMTGQQLYERAAGPATDRASGHPKSTEAMRNMGIAGIRYLDAQSRLAGGGIGSSSNLVTFESPRLLSRHSPATRAAPEPAPAAPAIVGDRSKFVDPDTGLALGGPGYTKEAQAINRDIAAGPKGQGPMDMSLQKQTPDVLQQPLDRYVPPRGISARMQDALENPAVHEGLADSMRSGAGVSDWYHTEPVRQEFLKTMGPEEGENAFKRFMDIVAATSPRSDVPTNVRNASYYYAGGDPAKANPYPYGHVAQNLHKQNVTNLNERGGWDVMQNPKPASFAENLRGNLEPVTVDTHAFRNIGMRTGDPRFLETSISQLANDPSELSMARRLGEIKQKDGKTVVTYRPQQLVKEGKLTMEEAQKIPSFWTAKPKDNEYGAAEQLFRDVGKKVGMRPADAQAAAWAGGGDMTGLGTVGTHTFPELMNERITFTAKMRGEDPKKVLNDFITGKKPLLSMGGAAAVGGGAMFGSLDGSPAEAAGFDDFHRSPNIEDRRNEIPFAPHIPPDVPHVTQDDLEHGRYEPPSVLNRALGGGDLDRGVGIQMLRDRLQEQQLLEQMRKSEPKGKRRRASLFGSLDGGR